MCFRMLGRCLSSSMATSLEDLRSPYFWRAVAAELLGTGVLVLIGCGSCVGGWVGDKDASPSMVQIALAFGLAVATVVWSIAHVSGGHINPAVTAGMLVTRKISVLRGLLFVVAQCVGAAAGAGILKAVTPPEVRGGLGATAVNSLSHVTAEQAFGVELLITFVLVFTVFATCDSKRSDMSGSGPLSIGLSVTMCHLFAIRYSGSSMNPARTFGPAIIMGSWHNHWVYWCGPLVGGIVAGLLYENIFAANASLSKAKAFLLTNTYVPDDFEKITDGVEVASRLNNMNEKERLKAFEAEANV